MKQAFTNPKLAVCLYNNFDDGPAVAHIKNFLLEKYTNYTIQFFENYSPDNDSIKNLWLSAFKKESYELDSDRIFDLCLAINTSHVDLLETINIPQIIYDKLYYVSGFANMFISSTGIDLNIFFAKTTIFDIACNFYLAKDFLPKDKKGTSIEESFYYYCKGFKIKTECVNYENSSLFKRTAKNS